MYILHILTQKNNQLFTEVLNGVDYAQAIITIMIAAQKSKDKRERLLEIHLYPENSPAKNSRA